MLHHLHKLFQAMTVAVLVHSASLLGEAACW